MYEEYKTNKVYNIMFAKHVLEQNKKKKLINYALKACFRSVATKNNKIAQEIRITIRSSHSIDRKIILA